MSDELPYGWDAWSTSQPVVGATADAVHALTCPNCGMRYDRGSAGAGCGSCAQAGVRPRVRYRLATDDVARYQAELHGQIAALEVERERLTDEANRFAESMYAAEAEVERLTTAARAVIDARDRLECYGPLDSALDTLRSALAATEQETPDA